MRVLLFGVHNDLGFAIAKRLMAEGHKVAGHTVYPASSWKKSGLVPILGAITDAPVQRELTKADAVIDAAFPCVLLRKRVQTDRLRPCILRKALQGSNRRLIVTSSATILGDTGPVPAGEDARTNPLPGFAWVPKLEKDILKSSGVHGVVIRPAWTEHGNKGWRLGMAHWITLALRFKRGTYIGSVENCYSAVHVDDLADLYCLALKGSAPGTVLHGASRNFSMKEMADSIHRGLKLKGEASSLSLEEARRWTPVADALVRSHAMSSDLAKRTLGWHPSRDSLMKEIESEAYLSRRELGRVPPPCFPLAAVKRPRTRSRQKPPR